MKQAILNLKKKLLLVEIGGKLSDEFVQVIDEYGMVEVLGKLTDITESQCEEWVEWIEEPQYYRDYRKEGWQGDITAKESFFSYLESEGIYFKNPLDWEKEAYLFKGSENTWGQDDLDRWQEAESKVWKKDQCYLFEILN